MAALRERRSIVGIDPTPRGIVFVFFERGELLDWGHRSGKLDVAAQLAIVDRLIDGCAADVLVLEHPDATGCRRRPRVRSLLRAIQRHGQARQVAVMLVARHEVRRVWQARGVNRKDVAAAAMAKDFPSLASLVPPRRKSHMNEDPRVNIFDALSLVLAAFDRSSSVGR
jgi:hypothetical protein